MTRLIELESVIQKYRERKVELDARQNLVIADVRDIVKQYQDSATIHLGGVPTTVADMMDFVRSDLVTFWSPGVLAFILPTPSP